ncbi:MAG: aminotransferase class I/II-fold pyridoxal phosphate-dependent enzyme [Clostridia bacterium]|nr:aminotransferase class I/II-fold pyridoxal phosphate-dependent enzyme [Clostridia bacterium]
MNVYSRMKKEELSEEYSSLMKKYNEYCEKKLSLDLSRGKPNSEQLDITQGIAEIALSREECFSRSGFDCRNYGMLDGLPEMKKLFSEVYGIPEEYIVVGGNSSLQLMYDTLSRAMLFGNADSERPWCREEGLKWICVTPGYDRHFAITEKLGFELVSVKMTPTGPDMDEVERLALDPKVKGIWCVPKYSNPTGNTYSDETVRRLVSMKCAAPDFRIMWDNAYAIHDLAGGKDELLDIFSAAREYGTEDRVLYFSSTSKITFPGAGVAMVAASPKNRDRIISEMSVQTIGYDKINQLRHIKYFKNSERVSAHMKSLGEYISRKFSIVLNKLASLKRDGVAEWTTPNGGYFISLDVLPGCATRVFNLMKAAGVTLTPVGATYPYGKDPEDKNLRIAPTYPSDADLSVAVDILKLAVRIAAIEKATN